MIKELLNFKARKRMRTRHNIESNNRYNNYDIILHIGSPKSGTSALQNFLLNNRDLLFDRGIFYPTHALDGNGISGGHSLLAIALIENRLEDANNIFSSWINEAKKSKKTLLLSSESFFNLSKKLAPFLTDKKFLIISYHRDISDYTISVHNQLIKRHFGTQTLVKYIEKIIENSSPSPGLVNKPFPQIYEEWEALAGSNNMIVQEYAPEYFLDKKIEKDFLSIIGVDCHNFKIQNKKINSSYTKDALELKRLINHILTEDTIINHKIDLTLQDFSDRPENKKKSQSDSLDHELRLKLKSYFSDDEEKIHNKHIKNKLKTDQDQKKENTNEKNYKIDLKPAFDRLTEDTEIKNYLTTELLKRLENGDHNYATFKLAELLEIKNIESYEKNDIWFSQKQINNMSSGHYKEADFLRDIARILIQRGDFENADSIISKALELRPKGPEIMKIKKIASTKNKQRNA